MVMKLEYEKSRHANVGVICLGSVKVGLASSLGCGITTCTCCRTPFDRTLKRSWLMLGENTPPEIAHE